MAAIRLLPPSPTQATGTLTLTGNPSDTETFVVGNTTYTMDTSLTDSANHILIGADATATCNNIVAAVMGASGAGSTYGTGTVEHTQVTAVRSGTTVVFTARADGAAGALVATTEALTNATFGAATLTGAGSTSSSTPTLTSATAGVAIPHACDQALILVRSVLGSGTMTASPVLWGFSPDTGVWYRIGALNGGSAIAETTSDHINYAELVVGLRGFSRLYCELTVAGTGTEVQVYAYCNLSSN